MGVCESPFKTRQEAKEYVDKLYMTSWDEVQARFNEPVFIPLGDLFFLKLDKDFAEEIATMMAGYILGKTEGAEKEYVIETAREWQHEYGAYGDSE